MSYLTHAVIEMTYLNNADNITWYKHWGTFGCALPPIIQYGLLAIGVIGGFFVGRLWWRVVYIEKRHWRFKNERADNQQSKD